ncbi:MAG: hypothetical protein AB8C84_12920 [Oligoflexales bacterium]
MIPQLDKVSSTVFGATKYAMLFPRSLCVLKLTWDWWQAYKTAQENVDDEQAKIIETLQDRKIKPQDEKIYPYLFASIYVLSGSAIIMKDLPQKEFKNLLRMTENLIQESCYIFTRIPTRMAMRQSFQHPLVKLLHQIDGPTNCFPSLHVSLAIMMKEVIENHEGMDPFMKQVYRETCIDICRSTLELKQHGIVDVLSGQDLAHRILSRDFQLDSCEDLSSEILPEINQDLVQDLRKALSECEDVVEALPYMLKRLNSSD